MMKNVNIDGQECQPVDDPGESLCIVICDNRGLTFIGYVNIGDEFCDEIVTIRDARCIIRWGSLSGHIAEIAKGPTSNTKLGEKRTFYAMGRNIIGFYKASQEGWSSHV